LHNMNLSQVKNVKVNYTFIRLIGHKLRIFFNRKEDS